MTMDFDHAPRRSSLTALDRAAQGLGMFSIALGVAELAFPGTIGRTLGLEGRQGLLRAYGVRDVITGISALQPNPMPAMWARVAGDVLDLVTNAQNPLGSDDDKRRSATNALVTVGAVTLVDLLVASAWSQQIARPAETRDYSDRSGYPSGIEAARGARANYTPRDFQVTPRKSDGAKIEMRPS